MSTKKTFEPDWYSPPGHTVLDVLQHRNVTVHDFGIGMGLNPNELRDLFQGVLSITEDLAQRLAIVLGSTPQFWLRREEQYRVDLERLADRKSDINAREWLRELPVADMISFGWIDPGSSHREKIAACLDFFGVHSVAQWRDAAAVAPAFRSSPTFESQPGAVAAWLRRGEIEAEDIACDEWNADRFKALLPTLRSLSRKKDPEIFIPLLREKCAKSGVAVVVVRAPNGCRASGATWLLASKKAVLMLSFRHLSDDQFWFTFFHEAGHLVLHGGNSVVVEWDRRHLSKEEKEANEFAVNTLVPLELQKAMLALPAKAMPIIRFAHEVGVSPGIIVGQLQHFGRLSRDELNFIKRRFYWE